MPQKTLKIKQTTISKLLDLPNSIYDGSTKNVQDRKNNHEGEGFYGTMYYAKTNNMHSAENRLLAERRTIYNEHHESNQTSESGFVYSIVGHKSRGY